MPRPVKAKVTITGYITLNPANYPPGTLLSEMMGIEEENFWDNPELILEIGDDVDIIVEKVDEPSS